MNGTLHAGQPRKVVGLTAAWICDLTPQKSHRAGVRIRRWHASHFVEKTGSLKQPFPRPLPEPLAQDSPSPRMCQSPIEHNFVRAGGWGGGLLYWKLYKLENKEAKKSPSLGVFDHENENLTSEFRPVRWWLVNAEWSARNEPSGTSRCRNEISGAFMNWMTWEMWQACTHTGLTASMRGNYT